MTVQQTFAFSDIILLSPRAIIKVPELQVYFRFWKEKRGYMQLSLAVQKANYTVNCKKCGI